MEKFSLGGDIGASRKGARIDALSCVLMGNGLGCGTNPGVRITSNDWRLASVCPNHGFVLCLVCGFGIERKRSKLAS